MSKVFVGVGIQTGNMILGKEFKVDEVTDFIKDLESKRIVTFGAYRGSEGGLFLEEVVTYNCLSTAKILHPEEESFYTGAITNYVELGSIELVTHQINALDVFSGRTFKVLNGTVYACIITSGKLVMNKDIS